MKTVIYKSQKGINKRAILMLVALLPVVTGCAHSSEVFAKETIQGEVFAKELARLYQEFAASEVEAFDWKDAKYFSDKGMRAARGIDVDPEHPEDWDVAPTMMPALLEARRTLLDVLTGENITKYPKLSAKAHFQFDCWVEELEEWREDKIEACKSGLYETLDAIVNPPAPKGEAVAVDGKTKDGEKSDAKAAPVGEVTEEKAVEVEKVDDKLMTSEETNFVATDTITFIKEKAKPKTTQYDGVEDEDGSRINDGNLGINVPDVTADTNSYYVFFADSSADISTVGITILGEISKKIKSLKEFEITALGYISRGESDAGNDQLAEQRAEAVYNALVKNGVDKTAIDHYGFTDANTSAAGETDDDAKSARRVEIFIK